MVIIYFVGKCRARRISLKSAQQGGERGGGGDGWQTGRVMDYDEKEGERWKVTERAGM